jgi:hypothetical protein
VFGLKPKPKFCAANKNSRAQARIQNYLQGKIMLENALNNPTLSDAEKRTVQQQAQIKGIGAALGLLGGLLQAARERYRALDAKIERMEAKEERRWQQARTPARPAFDMAKWKQQDYAESARWEQQQAYQAYRQGEWAEPQPQKPAGLSLSKPWWQKAGDWLQQKVVQPVQQAVPKVMNWVDQHQREIAIGIGIAAGVAAVVLSGGAATPLVAAAWVVGSAVVAGGVAAAGTVGLNAYFHRPLGTNVLQNLGYAAGAAAVTATAGFALAGGVVQQGLYAVGNTATRLCVIHPTACARVGAAFTLWDKVEDLGLQAKLVLQTWQRDPRAADTALELQLERLDNTPGNTTFREIYENAIALFERHSDEAAQIAGVIMRHGDDVLDAANDGVLRVRPAVAADVAEELRITTGRNVWFSKNGTIYISRSTHSGIESVARLEMAVKSGTGDDVINQLIEEVAAASTRGSGQRVVLGAWRQGGGYIGEAMENGGIFFDTGDEVWEALRKNGVDPWLVNEAFLRRQLETGVKSIEFVGEDVLDVINNPSTKQTYRAAEIRWLLNNAANYGYSRVGNRWVRTTP